MVDKPKDHEERGDGAADPESGPIEPQTDAIDLAEREFLRARDAWLADRERKARSK
jgi:hypothetical protein